MKTSLKYTALATSLLLSASLQAKIITVNTTDNTNFGAGVTNLIRAINTLADGDTIAFNIPGGGVQYIQTPPDGYPLITNSSVTIDGYTQPGASPNSNPIHAPNNAHLKIVLTSTNGNALSMLSACQAASGATYAHFGFGDDEMAILGFFRGTNNTVRGLCIQSRPEGYTTANGGPGVPGTIKAFAFAADSIEVGGPLANAGNWHVSGCWFGLDPATGQPAHVTITDGSTYTNIWTSIPGICIAAYRTRNNDGSNPVYPWPGTIGVSKNSLNPMAEFNVILTGYGFDSEGHDWRICGNFWNVLPDGLHNFDVMQYDPTPFGGPGYNSLPTGPGAQAGDGYIESGRDNSNITIGTDGDGINDAQEGNVFGGTLGYADPGTPPPTYNFVGIDLYSNGNPTNCVVAGNYFGVGIDGTTRFTNAMVLVHSFGSPANVRFGSDFDGVSDALEGNVIYNNYPFSSIYTNLGNVDVRPPTAFDGTGTGGFGGLNAGVLLSFRGNVTVGNALLPFNYFDGTDPSTSPMMTAWTNYEAPFISTSGPLLPVLSGTNIFPRLSGTIPVGIGSYTTVILDVYQLDPEGWSDGQQFAGADGQISGSNNILTDRGTFTNGFAQGKKYIGSFTVPNTGTFNITLPASADLGLGQVTVTANYSADPVGTHNGRVHTTDFSVPAYMLPGNAASVGLTLIQPDMPLWYDGLHNYVTNGPVSTNNAGQLGNWEPYAGVLGDSTFLIEFNTFANDGTLSQQNFCVAAQPTGGGTPKISYEFYDDSGNPAMGVIDPTRNNGNPGRVAGDMRYGAVNLISECETSVGQQSAFQSDSRWTLNSMYASVGRWATEQLFSLNPLTLAKTPLQKAYDYVWGPFSTNASVWRDSGQVSRTGGRPNFLDNGNIVVMIDDRTGYLSPNEIATFAIINPSGTVLKSFTAVETSDPEGTDIWDNMSAYKGGFVIRSHTHLFFYDNNGNLQHSNDVNVSSGLAYGGGRNDSTRVGSDIRSRYVFVAGRVPDGGTGPVYVSAWDSQTGNWIANALVSDTDPTATGYSNDRVMVAADALDRVCVVWPHAPNADFAPQIAARALQLNGTSFSYLTHSFYPFVNTVLTPGDSLNSGITWTGGDPTVAMTPRAICIGAKGTINSTNNPSAGADTSPQVDTYVVVSHPVPVAAPVPTITASKSGSNLVVSWNVDAGLFTVQTTPQVQSSGTVWTDFTVGNVPPPVNVPISAANKYVRLVRHF